MLTSKAIGAVGVAPVTYVGFTEVFTTTDATSVVINVPTGTQNGDLMLLFGSASGMSAPFNDDIATPSGWNVAQRSGYYSGKVCVFYKTASSEPSSYTVSTAANFQSVLVMVVYRNADFVGTGFISPKANPISPQKVFIPNENNVLLGWYGTSYTSALFGTPTGMTKLTTGTNRAVLFYQENVAVGDSGTRNVSMTGGGGPIGMGVLAVVVPKNTVPPVPEFVAVSDVVNDNSNSVMTINTPTGTADGDLMLACIYTNSNSLTFTPPSGWTTSVAYTADGSMMVAYKVAASEGSTLGFTKSTALTTCSGYVVTYRNANYGTTGSVVAGTTATEISSISDYYSSVLYFAADDTTSLVVNTAEPTKLTTRVLSNISSRKLALLDFSGTATKTIDITGVDDTGTTRDVSVLVQIGTT